MFGDQIDPARCVAWGGSGTEMQLETWLHTRQQEDQQLRRKEDRLEAPSPY